MAVGTGAYQYLGASGHALNTTARRLQVLTPFSSRLQQVNSISRNVSAMALQYPAPIVSNPSGSASATVIFLHGLGDTGAGWADIAPQFQSSLKHVKFIFPTAPKRPITLNWGMAMPGWYDIASLDDINQKEDEAGLKESFRYIESIVESEVAAGIPPSRIAVGGFSQGGAIALMMLRSKTQLGAIIGLSTYLPLATDPDVVSSENKNTPVLMCHGDADNVVAYQFGRQSHSKLEALGVNADFKTYSGMGHSACQSELVAIAEFIAKQLPAK